MNTTPINCLDKMENSQHENGIVIRYNLFNMLDNILHKKITYIHGPAGYGKTSLLLSWISKNNLISNTVWKDMHEPQCTESKCMYELVLSLEKYIHVNANCESEPITNNNILLLKLNRILKEVADLKKQTLIVIDNFQKFKEKSILETCLNQRKLIEDNIHFIFISRSLPIIGISQLKLENSLLEIGMNQLRFTLKETEILFNEVYNLNLSKNEIHDIDCLIEGWPSILKLVALTIQEKRWTVKNIKDNIKNNYYVCEYFYREIFQHFNENIKAFMIKTSILDTLDYELCMSLTGESCVAKIIDELYSLNIIKESSDTGGLCYFPLIKLLLNNMLLRQDVNALKALCLHAASWYEKNDMLDNAFDYYLRIKNYDQYMELLEQNANEFISNAEFVKFISLAEKLPIEELPKKVILVIYYCTCLALIGKLDKGESILSLKGINLDSEIFKDYKPEIFSIRITSAIVRLDLNYGLELNKDYVQGEPSIKLFKEISSANLGELNFYLGDLDKAETCYNTYNSYFKRNQNIYLYSIAQYKLAFIKYLKGNLHEASKLYSDNINMITHNDKPITYAIDMFYMGLGDIYYEIDDIDKSLYYINKAIEITTVRKGYDDLIPEYLLLAKIMHKKNDQDTVLKLINNILDIVNRHSSEFIFSLSLFDMVILLDRINRLDIAKNFMLKYFQAENNLHYYAYEAQNFTRIFFMYKQNKFNSALKLLNAMESSILKSNNIQSKIKYLLLISVVKYKDGSVESALTKLHAALILGYKHSYRRIFLDCINQIGTIIKDLKNSNLIMDAELLDYINSINKCSCLDAEIISYNEIENNTPLSKRENEVLKLVADGMSNIEISKKIYISESTVKKHINSIFNKLEVKNRAQAIKFYNKISV